MLDCERSLCSWRRCCIRYDGFTENYVRRYTEYEKSKSNYIPDFGFVFDLFGKVPVKFEKASWNDFDFIVQDIEGHRINSVKVIKKSNDDGSSNDKKE